MGDPVGADRACVPDVDGPRVGDVDRQPEGDQHDRREPDPAHRHRWAQALATAPADPEHPHQQVDERRVGERDRDPDLAAVEVVLRDPEREQDEQVEVGDPYRTAEVEQAGEKDQRQRDPHVGGVEDMAELALVAARHRPGDLIAGQRLGDRPGVRVDLDLRNLVVAVLVADLPEPVVVDLDRGRQAPVAGGLRGDLGGRRRRSASALVAVTSKSSGVVGRNSGATGAVGVVDGTASPSAANAGELISREAATASAAARSRTSTACCR